MPYIVLTLVLGISAFQQLAHLPDIPTLLGWGLLTTLFAYRRYWPLAAFLFGWLWSGLFAYWQLHERLAPQWDGEELTIQGYISNLPQSDSRKCRFDFTVTQAPEGVPPQIKLSWYNPVPTLLAGQYWALRVKLKPAHGLLNPGGFDYERWLFSQGITATGYVRHPESAQPLVSPRRWPSVTELRQHIATHLFSNSALHYPAFISALTIGDTRGISPPQWQVLRETGTLHLLAISGSHISLLAGFMYWLTRHACARLGLLRYPPQQVAAVVSMLTAFCYALLAGFAIPTQRALIMLSIVMLAILWQRQVRISHTLALAMLLIVLSDPLAVLSPGFWLSFIAVALIFFIITGRISPPKHWQSALKVQGMLTVGLAPLLVCLFQQLSLVAPLANLIAVPVINFIIVPLGLLAVALGDLCPNIANVLLLTVDQGIGYLWDVLTHFAAWPHAQISGWSVSLPAMFLASLGMLVLWLPMGLPGRWLGALLCLPLLFNAPKSLPPGTVKLTLLDVGQGLASVVQTAKHSLIFDSGIRFSDDADSAKSVILPFLAQQGIHTLDALIISHGDNDHIGGAASLLAAYPSPLVYSSVPEQLPTPIAQHCLAGQHWIWDNVVFSMLNPNANSAGFSENDNSCVLHIQAGNASFLLTGDIEELAETSLVHQYADTLHADVLIAPHHGSKTSSSDAFLQAVAPKVVLIPNGYHNPFHFPHPTVLARYAAHNIPWLSTALHGALTVTSSTNGMQLLAWRMQAAKYWHAQPEAQASDPPSDF